MTTTTQALDRAVLIPTSTGAAKFARDTGAVFHREILLVLRDPFTLIFSLLQPLIYLGLFGPLLSGLVNGQDIGSTSPLQWFLPGVVVMICLYGTSMTGSNLLFEMQTGSYERVLATPLSRASIIVGRSLKEFAPLVVQAALITLIAWPFGFVLYPPQIFVGLIILGVFGIGLGALSYSLAIASKDNEWMFWGVQQTLLMPLLILSGMMLPLAAGPTWMQNISKVNPLLYIVNAERDLFSGSFATSNVAWGAIAALVTCGFGLWLGIRMVRKGSR